MMDAFATLCAIRWPEGIKCPHCGHDKVYPMYRRPTLICASKLCRKHFSPTSGTIFSGRKMAPEQYVNAIWAYPTCSSPTEMQKILEVDYRTAHSIYNKLKLTGGKLL